MFMQLYVCIYLILLVSLTGLLRNKRRRLALADSKDVSTCQAFGSKSGESRGRVRIIF